MKRLRAIRRGLPRGSANSRTRVDDIGPRIDAAGVAQERVLADIAVRELESQKRRLASYATQAQFALAAHLRRRNGRSGAVNRSFALAALLCMAALPTTADAARKPRGPATLADLATRSAPVRRDEPVDGGCGAGGARSYEDFLQIPDTDPAHAGAGAAQAR